MAIDDRSASLSGLTPSEAKEFHKIFMTSFIGFVIVALIAHFLVWEWRPWLPGVHGYSMLDGAQGAVGYLKSFVA
jgi:light-harvesting complex 1 beta chain